MYIHVSYLYYGHFVYVYTHAHPCSYSLYHVTRKSFSNVKSVMQVALSPSNHTEYSNLYPADIWDSKQFFASRVSHLVYHTSILTNI